MVIVLYSECGGNLQNLHAISAHSQCNFEVVTFVLLQDNIVPVECITPPFKGLRPKEVERISNQLLFPVNVPGDRQYYLSVPSGLVLEKEVGCKCMPHQERLWAAWVVSLLVFSVSADLTCCTTARSCC